MHAQSQPLYQQLADYYRQAILSGALPPAARMPSVRHIVRMHQVSLSTALHVCRKLEKEGLIEARARSGYFVCTAPPPGLLAPASEPDMRHAPDPARYVGIHERVSNFVTRCEQYVTTTNLALAAAAPTAYPHTALRQSMSRALRKNPEALTSRTPRKGHPALRTVLARRMLDCGIRTTADEVLITHGCTEALNLALRAVAQPGDTIAVESPTYFGLLQILESLGLRALEIPTSPHRGLSVDALELALRTHDDIRAVVVVPNLQNPLGCIMPDGDKKRLLDTCVAQHVAVIEDDTYGALADAGPQLAIKHWDIADNVIYCSSLHKTLAPGMRLGWIVAGRWHARVDMLKFAQSRYNEALGQLAAADYMSTKTYDRHLIRLRHQLAIQRATIATDIAREFPPGTRLSLPSGGMLLWVELPATLSGMAIFEQALMQGVRVAPGAMFSNSHRYDHFLRLSCGQADLTSVTEAIRILGTIAKSQAPRAENHPQR